METSTWLLGPWSRRWLFKFCTHNDLLRCDGDNIEIPADPNSDAITSSDESCSNDTDCKFVQWYAFLRQKWDISKTNHHYRELFIFLRWVVWICLLFPLQNPTNK